MTDIELCLPEAEALGLYQLLHRLPQGQETYVEAYRQLQTHFFQILTVDQLTKLLESQQ